MTEESTLWQRIRRPLILAVVGGVFMSFFWWAAPQLRDDLWFMRFEESCNRGNQEDCAGVGWRYMTGVGVERDYARGVEMLRESCVDDVVWACAALGNTYWWTGRTELMSMEDTGRARDLCRDEDVDICAYLLVAGSQYEVTFGVDTLQKPCLEGNDVACWAALPESIDQDWEHVDDICARGFTHACLDEFDYGTDNPHEELYWREQKVGDEFRGERERVLWDWVKGELHDDAVIDRLGVLCARDPVSCRLAAKLRARRTGHFALVQDWELAHAHYAHACERKSAWGCWGMGRYHEEMWRRWQKDTGWKPAATRMSARSYYQQSCDLGHAPACVWEARVSGFEAGDKGVTRARLEHWCKRENLHACDALIEDLREGEYGPVDEARAEVVQEAVCKAGAQDYCDHWLLGRRRP